MGPKKLTPTKKGKRPRTEAEMTSDDAFDRSRFRDAERQSRYDSIRDWTFIPERRVELQPEEMTEFTDELRRRRWLVLAQPMAKYDPDIVKEFYANAWPTEVGKAPKRSKVRGRWVPYDRNAINEFLGNPLVLEDGDLCWYQTQRKKIAGFDDSRTVRRMCVPGKSFETNHAGQPLRILRGNMNTLTQIWMSFLLANIVPMLHTSDLNLPRCYLIYSILIRATVDIATVISEEIHQFVISEIGRRQDQSKKPLGFPALITALCAAHGVEVNPSKAIRPPIDKKFVDKYCTHPSENQQAVGPPEVGAGPSNEQEPSFQQGSHPSRYTSSVTEQLRRLELSMQHLHAQQAATYRGQVHLQQSFHTLTHQLQTQGPYSWPTPEEFSTYVSWPGDSPNFAGVTGDTDGVRPDQGDADDDIAADAGDEEMRDHLDDVIGGQ